ncbi:hypothetical protein LUZ60_005104 [Juncus effusus]|nr:hypothetical protein LUZ60_005104 [Juncus effusus]
MAAAAGHVRHTCGSASETREWMNSIASFLLHFKPLLEAHVVNFFKDNLWEIVDNEWMDCLSKDHVQNLLKIPSGHVQEYWPTSLKEFVINIKSLSISREQNLSHPILKNISTLSLGTVLSQGMNAKKKHEVEILAATTSRIACNCGADTVIDVGSGQGYLAQALSFEYNISVIAIDASVHHANVTNSRAERIKKHYKSKCGEKEEFKVPQTVTCRVISSEMLTNLTGTVSYENGTEKSLEKNHLVLAGLHACGDLSVNMLRAFVGCEKAKGLVSLGCCYNLLLEHSDQVGPSSGFPMSEAARNYGFTLGKNTRDLACQSAERWRSLTKDIALQNFDVHAFRAAFQLVLEKHFPDVMKSNSSPSIGRQGKALRRQTLRKVLEGSAKEDFISDKDELIAHDHDKKYADFKAFCEAGLGRLGCGARLTETHLLQIWNDVRPFTELVGSFWSIRAALGQVIETYILLDRLLFLQEQGNSIEAFLVPLFDPGLSPRNVAIIAQKV